MPRWNLRFDKPNSTCFNGIPTLKACSDTGQVTFLTCKGDARMGERPEDRCEQGAVESDMFEPPTQGLD